VCVLSGCEDIFVLIKWTKLQKEDKNKPLRCPITADFNPFLIQSAPRNDLENDCNGSIGWKSDCVYWACFCLHTEPLKVLHVDAMAAPLAPVR